jgi:hypothetical protein
MSCVATAVGATAFVSDAASGLRDRARSRCPTHRQLLRADPISTRGSLRGNVVGDRRPERVSVKAFLAAPSRCRYFVVVRTGGGRAITAPVRDGPAGWAPDAIRSRPWPRLNSLVELAPRGPLAVAVTLDEGASSVAVGLYVVRPTTIRILRVDRPPVHNLFYYGGGASTALAVDCSTVRGRRLVVQSAAERTSSPRIWRVHRRWYRLSGSSLRLVAARTQTISPLTRLPEFRVRNANDRRLQGFRACTRAKGYTDLG